MSSKKLFVAKKLLLSMVLKKLGSLQNKDRYTKASKNPGVLVFLGASVCSVLQIPFGEVKERFIVHLGYERERGKTVLLKLIKSIWGKKRDLILAAKSTDKAIRKLAGKFGSQ
jgi:uncharacterized protein (DUF927 family)